MRSTFSHALMALAACAAGLLFSSCGSSSKPNLALSAQSIQLVQALPDDGTPELFRLMNEARRKKRRPQLTIDPRITLAAKDHSDSMAQHNYFAHKGRDGSNFQVRMERRGYPLSHSAENLAMAQDAQRVFQMWWNSKGHKTNMMNKKYTRVGLVRTGDYWTANYAAPDGT